MDWVQCMNHSLCLAMKIHHMSHIRRDTFSCQWGTIAYQRLVGKSLRWAPHKYDWFDHCVPEQTPHKAPLSLPALSHTSRTALDEIDRTRMIQACSMRNWCLLHLRLGSDTQYVLFL